MKKFRFTEDWTVVFIGFLIIAWALLFGGDWGAPKLKWSSLGELTQLLTNTKNLKNIGFQFGIILVSYLMAKTVLGQSLKGAIAGISILFLLSLLAQVLAGNKLVQTYNLEAVIFSLAIGLVLNNVFSVPEFIKNCLSSELFVKIGLVLLGTTVIFSEILQAGMLGLIQALFVVVSVWYFAFWVCKKLKVDQEMSLMISSAVSICGVSAAIATSGAIKGDSKKLSYVISMVLITAIPMMIFMPYLAQWMGLSETVTGAWLGGSIDTTGAVVASGSLVGEEALKISTIIKFSQNVLLGLAAFAISIYWSVNQAQQTAEKPTVGVIWERFPKFVIGFVGASLLFSFVLPQESISQVKPILKNIQGAWFALAFVSIGLETNLKDLISQDNKKPLVAFLTAQLFNVIITLIIALLLFGNYFNS